MLEVTKFGNLIHLAIYVVPWIFALYLNKKSPCLSIFLILSIAWRCRCHRNTIVQLTFNPTESPQEGYQESSATISFETSLSWSTPNLIRKMFRTKLLELTFYGSFVCSIRTVCIVYIVSCSSRVVSKFKILNKSESNTQYNVSKKYGYISMQYRNQLSYSYAKLNELSGVCIRKVDFS